jgi:hypothetical protein
MKVIGETFPFILKRKGAEEVRYKIYLNFQEKGLLPDRTRESFIKKAPTEQFLNFRKTYTEFTKRLISYESKIFIKL